MDADGTHPIQEKNNTGEDRDKRTNDSVAKSRKKKKTLENPQLSVKKSSK